MGTKEEVLHEELRSSAMSNLVLLGVTMLLFLVALGALGSYFVRLKESRQIINCASFSSYAEMLNFVDTNPVYRAKLDKDNDGTPCEELYYQQFIH